MQHKHLQFGHGFRVVLGDEHSQAAQMTLGPGETEGGPDNNHRGADQWLYVVSGSGQAIGSVSSFRFRRSWTWRNWFASCFGTMCEAASGISDV